MKKILSLILIAMMLTLIFAGCSAPAAPTTAPAPATTAAPTAVFTTAPAATAAPTPTIDAIKKNGKLIMATNAEFPPYEYHDGDKIVGFDVELATAIAKKIGVPLSIEDMAFDSVIASIQTGKADVAVAGLTITDERKQMIDFSDSYITSTQAIIVKDGSKIVDADGLKGKHIGVQTGTTGEIYCGDIEKAKIDSYSKGADAVLDLINGKLDAVVIDEQPAKKFVESNKGLKVLSEPLTKEDYAIGMKKGSTDLALVINAVIKELKASGDYQKLLDKYIG